MTRHKMRENAFLLIFEDLFSVETTDTLLHTAEECEDIEINDTVKALFCGVVERKEELDEKIAKHLKGWAISRISKVSLAILRLAVYEICYEEKVDAPVAINEAVELAKAYSGQEDAAFINGVLGSFVRQTQEQQTQEQE